jgi:hypothetical protein
MDFIVRLPCIQDGYDLIWVIMDRLTKVAHFIPIKTTYSGAKLAELYMSRIICLHGVPKKIVSVSYSILRKRERSLHTCAQDVQITRIVTT